MEVRQASTRSKLINAARGDTFDIGFPEIPIRLILLIRQVVTNRYLVLLKP